jgi:hypothetical protein
MHGAVDLIAQSHRVGVPDQVEPATSADGGALVPRRYNCAGRRPFRRGVGVLRLSALGR